MKDPFSSDEHHAIDNSACKITGSVRPEKGGAILAGVTCTTLCVLAYCAIGPLFFKLTSKLPRSSAFRVRRLRGLPNFDGLPETIAAITYDGMVLSFACFTIATADAAIFAFGSLVASRLLSVFDIVAGEKSGEQDLLRHRSFVIAEGVRQKVHADVSADELPWHRVRFLDLPANAEC